MPVSTARLGCDLAHTAPQTDKANDEYAKREGSDRTHQRQAGRKNCGWEMGSDDKAGPLNVV